MRFLCSSLLLLRPSSIPAASNIRLSVTNHHLHTTTRIMMSTSSSSSDEMTITTKDRLTNLITNALSPTHLEVINESHMHSVPKGSETHFRVIVVSDKFQGMMPVQRHRTVYGLAKPEMRPDNANPQDPQYFHQIHALAIVAKTTSEWGLVANDASLKKSPSCMGGEKKEREGKL